MEEQQENNEQPIEAQNEPQEEAPKEEEKIEEIPKKIYKPANPTIKECIELNELLPVSNVDKNLNALTTVIYNNDDLLNECIQKIDNRSTIGTDDSNKDFIKCEQNRDGDSYRSPHTNKYYPNIDGMLPSKELRELEEKLNKMFLLYVKQYYSSTAVGSVYCWDLGDNISDGFGVAIVIKNSVNHEKEINIGTWDSSNLITVNFSKEGGKIKTDYNMITTVTLNMNLEAKIAGNVVLGGTITRSAKATKMINSYMSDEHIENIGVLVEDIESKMRNTLNTIYVMKSKEIIDTARYNPTLGKPGIQQAQALKEAMMMHNQNQ